MKRLADWGFSRDSWKGERGEYLVLLQGLLMIGYLFIPVYRPAWLNVEPPLLYGIWAIAIFLILLSAIFMGKGLFDLGSNLTPLPYPKQDGQLIQSGVYSIVRHPLYSGLLLAAKGWTVWHLSLSHLAGVIIGFLFFNAKANREEIWLTEKYPDYPTYQQRVKKLIPWVY
ncbi:MAG: isoprenylcysteine carboxylmethyltransferase family protein [Cyanobacteria bacterium CRU_2_1]|nr:isoprenylcysteine carboxylmethyltransferase family protein [Cyanobacteria bacterium RU_5_0]NJR63252.1 isoprenylcysteine carboxylmethyltransferase family protein [Cyanobacteria bacterium CRU_2_1]